MNQDTFVTGPNGTQINTRFASPTLGRDMLTQNDPGSLANFQKANPTLSFTNQDYANYLSAGPIPQTITNQSLQTATPFALPPTQPANQANAFLNTLPDAQNQAQPQQNGNQGYLGQLGINPQDTANKGNVAAAALNELASFMQGKSGQTELTGQAYSQDLGTGQSVDQSKQELTDITNQINNRTQSYRRQIEAIQREGGRTVGGTNDVIANTQRQAASEIADLSVIQQAKGNNYANAKDIADRAVAIKLEKDSQRLDALKFYYQENKEQFNKADQRQYEALIKQNDREYARQERDLSIISDLSLNALKNNAPAGVAASMRKAQTVEEAIQIGGKYIDAISRQTAALQQQSLRQDIENKILENQKLVAESKANTPEAQAAKKQDEVLPTLSLVDSILSNPYLNNAVGLKTPGAAFGGFFGGIYGSNTIPVQNQIRQLQASLSLENRQKLKGTGAISDFESRTLNQASSAFSTGLNNDAAVRELKKIRGVMATASGLSADVKITDKKTGESRVVTATRDGINQAIKDGLLVEYQ